MQGKTRPRRGRPRGATTFDRLPAVAFGAVVRERRLDSGLSQEELASAALVERSHMGKIERGEHLPNLLLVLRLADALAINPGELLDEVARRLALTRDKGKGK
jgi:transcriptional regulator with XRE-family HTH domain